MDLSYERKRLTDAVRGLRLSRAPGGGATTGRRSACAPISSSASTALARHAVAHSPFWRERLGDGPVDLASVPALDKTTLMRTSTTSSATGACAATSCSSTSTASITTPCISAATG